MHDLAVRNARVLSHRREQAAHVYVDGARIAAVTEDERPAARTLDAGGRRVAPGLIDLHLNGAAGVDFTSLQLDALDAFEAHLLANGTTAYLAALNTDTLDQRLHALRTLRRRLDERPPGAPRCLGFMLEGPFYAESQRGAHDAALFRDPTLEEGEAVYQAAGRWLRVWSLAPERRGSEAFIRWLTARGIVAAVGHSGADFDQVGAAVDAGARLVTHVYACLTSYAGAGPSKRLGGNEAALFRRETIVEAIADGLHLTPPMLAWVARAAGPERLCLTTDAMAAAGLGDGVYRFLGSEVHVVDGRALRPDRTHFAGSTATLPQCVANLAATGEFSDADVVAAATEVPARLLGLWPERGALAEGSVADLVVLDDDGSVGAVVVGGAVAG